MVMHLQAVGGLSIYKGGSHTYSGRTPGKQRERFWEMGILGRPEGGSQAEEPRGGLRYL